VLVATAEHIQPSDPLALSQQTQTEVLELRDHFQQTFDVLRIQLKRLRKQYDFHSPIHQWL
jgi:hypothetical protein